MHKLILYNFLSRFLLFTLNFTLFTFFVTPAFANNLVISNVTLEDRNPSANTVVVEFDISWDHSWRKADGRRDAAWVFVKILDGNTGTPTYPWLHGKLYTAGTNPNDGTSVGTNSDLQIVIPADKIGAFIERRATGNGAVTAKNVRLVVDYVTSGAADGDTITAKVYGIEMTYISEGPFYIGDGDGSQEAAMAFHLDGVDNTAVQITTTGKAITVDSNASDDIDTSPSTVTGLAGITGNTSWPNGYDDFYVMKYELSQAQYVDFLNSLDRTAQGKRVVATVSGNTIANYYVMSDGTTVANRQGIRAPASGNGTTDPIVFGNDVNANGTFNQMDDGQTIAMNYINWSDLSAYADWAGLRPVTELEFEKAARGTNTALSAQYAWGNTAVYGEYAWGSTQITSATGPTNSGRSDEVSTASGVGLANVNLSSSPLRVGFSATNVTNRVGAGAGYGGNMNLSGNVSEFTVSLGHSVGRAYTGTHGDGLLTTTASYEANATNTDWPGIDATTARGVTGASGTGYRGGNFGNSTEAPIAYRTNATSNSNSRSASYGIRAARTAP